tara:strand:- start:1609 stop:2301 length:693 start_codon:yes stop_codon:yes gene_type:complete
MRHRKANNNLRRKTGHRKSMLANMSCSLIMHKRIKTTLAKAKVLKRFVEPIITKSKNDSTHNRRISFRYLRQKDAVTELFSTVSNKVADRPGGYTRIIKLGNRLGDAAEMCFIELVDFNDTYNVKTVKKKRTRRSKKNESDVNADSSNLNPDSTTSSNVTIDTEVKDLKAEEPKVEESKAEEPKVDESNAEEPKVEESKVEKPKSEKVKIEEDKTEMPKNNTDAKGSSEK